jgi:hypothetical protein
MVLDPLTAIGLAGNLVQFVDFSSKIVSKAKEIYNSAEGCLPEHNDAVTITKCLQTLNSKLQGRIRTPTTANEQVLQELWVGCEEVAQELLGVLEIPKLEGNKSKWKSVGRALKDVRRGHKIERISKRLVHLRERLILTLLVDLRNADIAQSRELFD